MEIPGTSHVRLWKENDTGGKVVAVKLRRLPYVPGKLTEAKGTDRLDIMAHRRYKDGTKFWHIADANTELGLTGWLNVNAMKTRSRRKKRVLSQFRKVNPC